MLPAFGSQEQTFLGHLAAKPALRDEWADRFLTIPFGIAILSGSMLLSRTVRSYASDNPDESHDHDRLTTSSHSQAERNGRHLRLFYMVLRGVGTAGLMCLSIPRVLQAGARIPTHTPFEIPTDSEFLINASLTFANTYAFLLACLAVRISVWRHWLVRHHIAILLSESAVYSVRNIWPLLTYTKQPMDLEIEGPILWLKIVLLALTSVVVPVLIPGVYTPADPKHPAAEVNQEQTASFFSFFTYSYISPVIAAAQKKSHLAASELPPLADYDQASFLLARASPYLSPAKVRRGRYLGYNLLFTFGRDYFKTFLGMTVYPLALLGSPLAVNRLLSALESNGENDTDVRT